MNYITVKEASLLWGMDISTIGKLLRAGKIPGGTKMGGHWIIPKDCPKPPDRRCRLSKLSPPPDRFRFPFYVDFPESHFLPPLTNEESRLRQAQLDFFACEMDLAKAGFSALAQEADSIYVKISALFFRCIISVYYEKGADFPALFTSFNLALNQCSSHQTEMGLHMPLFYLFMAEYQKASDTLNYLPRAAYSNDCVAMIALLTFSHLTKADPGNSSAANLDAYDILCRQTEENGFLYEAQEMHFLLFVCYHLAVSKSTMEYHLKKGLDLALTHNLILPAACYSLYYPEEFSRALADYPDSFTKKIRRYGAVIRDSISSYFVTDSNRNIYRDLAPTDYPYVFYVMMGYSNRQIAGFMNKSEKTIANRYNEIYGKLGIKGRKELKAQMNAIIGKE